MKKINLFAIAMLSMFAISCGTSFQDDTNTLLVNEWKLSKLASVENVNMPEVDSYTLSFDTVENRAFGKGNCNRYFASYKLDVENKTIKFSNPGSTMMMCQNDNAESQFLSIFDSIDSFRLNGEEVEVLSNDGKVLAIFTKNIAD